MPTRDGLRAGGRWQIPDQLTWHVAGPVPGFIVGHLPWASARIQRTPRTSTLLGQNEPFLPSTRHLSTGRSCTDVAAAFALHDAVLARPTPPCPAG
ncbi:hypothetical protein [Streptomyces sp. NPDC046385]|uniref:hypothetical protein n=1 Tax=unclassified Streptomyces TaxID=2593676 RepID=UPI003405D5EC